MCMFGPEHCRAFLKRCAAELPDTTDTATSSRFARHDNMCCPMKRDHRDGGTGGLMAVVAIDCQAGCGALSERARTSGRRSQLEPRSAHSSSCGSCGPAEGAEESELWLRRQRASRRWCCARPNTRPKMQQTVTLRHPPTGSRQWPNARGTRKLNLNVRCWSS